MNRASLSILGALDKFDLCGPQKIFMQKLLPIIWQFTYNINTLWCMHAHTILTLFVKSMISYCYCVHTAVSVGYSICYHITNGIVFGIVMYEPPYLMCIIYNVEANHTIIFLVTFLYCRAVTWLFTNHTQIILILQFQESTEPQA